MSSHLSQVRWNTVWGVAASVGAAALTSGCQTATPDADLARRDAPVRAEYAAAAMQRAAGNVSDDWLSTFNDATLAALVEEAMRNNPDLRIAAARVDEARARTRVAESYLWPQIDGAADVSRQRSAVGGTKGGTSTFTQYAVGGQLSWEVDLWGRLRSQSNAQRDLADATTLDYEFARLSLAAQMADAWFVATQACKQLVIDQERLETEDRTSRITRDKVDTGAGSQLDAELQESNRRLAADAVQRDELSILEASRAIELLLGRYPAAELALSPEFPGMENTVPIGLPSELLERRPDIRAADRRVAAAFHAREAAKAARLPRVTLSASLGWLIDPNAGFWSVGGGLLAPLVDGGRLHAEIEISDAIQRQEIAAYVQTAIVAFREVETALSSEDSLAKRQVELTEAVSRMNRAGQIGEDRYAMGVLSIVDLTIIRRQEFESRTLLLQVTTQRLRQRLALHRALGGSFDAPQQRADDNSRQDPTEVQ